MQRTVSRLNPMSAERMHAPDRRERRPPPSDAHVIQKKLHTLGHHEEKDEAE